MKRLIIVIAAIWISGCHDKTPTKDQAVEMAKEELSMALCGDRGGSCISQARGNAHISERLSDHTNNVIVTFKDIEQKPESPSNKLDISEGIIAFSFDAKNGETYVKEISLLSDDASHSIDLCGHNYTFCRK